MEQQPLTVRVGGSELIAVPALHFNHVFAREVHRLCSDPATRPDAVAVELGPIKAEVEREWMVELGVGPPSYRELPVMLSLVFRNRLIRASLKEKAIELQRKTGKDLSEISPEVLKRELGYSPHWVEILSPVDSITEAIRCAVELLIPVFGVDLDGEPGCAYQAALVQDPLVAGADMTGYVARNARWAVHGRDEEIDARREFAMAARLKGILRRYRRVLFTGGIGHWVRIKKLLHDPSVKPAALPRVHNAGKEVFKRMLVHPLIAVEKMDLLPALVKEYLDSRTPLDGHHPLSRASSRPFEVLRLFEKELERAYRHYFLGQNPGSERRRKNRELERIRGFETYLSSLCLFHQKEVPNLFLAVEAAKKMVGGEFSRALTNSFMDFPWASPEDHPDFPVYAPAADASSGANGRVLLGQATGSEMRIFWDAPPSWAKPFEQKSAYEWKVPEVLRRFATLDFNSHTWLPWDCLTAALCARAMELSISTRLVERVQEFSGSMRAGIHMRETIRSFARGYDRIYVRDFVRKPGQGKASVEAFPVVWLIDLNDDAECDWNVLHVPFRYLESYVRDRLRFDSIRTSRGSCMVAVIAYGKRDVNRSAAMEEAGVSIDRYRGVSFYLPLPWTNEQFAGWAEHTGYSRTPICTDTCLRREESELRRFFGVKHGIDLKEHHWSTAMIMLAIPFARKVLPVVVPQGFQIERAAYAKAARYGVGLSQVSLKHFDPSEVERLAACYLVPTISVDPLCVYSEEVEEAIGEKQTANQHMVPREFVEFGRREL